MRWLGGFCERRSATQRCLVRYREAEGRVRLRARPEPARNASFADGLRSMEIIEAVVKSAESDGAAVAVPAPTS